MARWVMGPPLYMLRKVRGLLIVSRNSERIGLLSDNLVAVADSNSDGSDLYLSFKF
jgi:hypothetical protein